MDPDDHVHLFGSVHSAYHEEEPNEDEAVDTDVQPLSTIPKIVTSSEDLNTSLKHASTQYPFLRREIIEGFRRSHNGVKYVLNDDASWFILPNQTIGKGAFVGCTTNIKINAETVLHEDAFHDDVTWSEVTGVSFHESITDIPAGLLASCKQLKTVLGKGIVQIGRRCFAESGISFAHLPKLRHVADESFQQCLRLERILLPDLDADIGSKAFEGCASLTRVWAPKAPTAGPSASPTATFSTPVTMEPQPLVEGDCSPDTPCEMCSGACSDDTDCADGLSCFYRLYLEYVPGCTGAGKQGQRYCYNPLSGGLTVDMMLPASDMKCDNKKRCTKCQGDCDTDDDCDKNLYCYRRLGYELVPGCGGQGAFGADYCFDPKDIPGENDY